MKNEIKKIKKELSLYLSSVEEDVILPYNRSVDKIVSRQRITCESKKEKLEILKSCVDN
ncbi:MAG: hypothetical protein GX447_09445, partial [Elusimicrobia bacterium]|nr:hypothetical protein [Elusimicrobiota bacterium]